ncbi:hypothetical protein QM480_05245 [Flectobacillus sp. DC10W]|jgi:hypothetical protein|uniref:Uncharacterized protein n=1 Tax=Flectobacillus longus TaxID=2984207 RepID=A0ABT6YJE5_9BACT|nr:hypothetical protein [Flectobacillus longus]MDI9863717.1 hypothetical protein [Flectobacillus longus]
MLRNLSYYLILLFFFFSEKQKGISQSISIQSGGTSWSVTVPASNITTAGLNYSTNMTSATNQSLMNVNTLLTYEVRAKKQDTLWDSRLELYVRKTGDGTPNILTATISPAGVGSYNLLSSSDVKIFSGLLGSSNIPLQYEIRGISVLVPVRTYSTTIVYTFVGL